MPELNRLKRSIRLPNRILKSLLKENHFGPYPANMSFKQKSRIKNILKHRRPLRSAIQSLIWGTFLRKNIPWMNIQINRETDLTDAARYV